MYGLVLKRQEPVCEVGTAFADVQVLPTWRMNIGLKVSQHVKKKNKTKKATSKNDNKPTLLNPNEDFAFGHLSKHSPLKETEISG